MIPKPYSTEVLRLSLNTKGRDLIVGDIHGCFAKLNCALAAVGFSPEAGDRLISVGDLVDRGPESHNVIAWLDEPWFFPVRGNHEDMLCMYQDGDCEERLYRVNGGGWFIDCGTSAREVFADRLKKLPLAIEIETARGIVAVVHADCPTPTWVAFKEALSHPEMGPRAAMACTWSRNRANGLPMGEVPDVVAVVVGHTPMERHTTMDNVHFIDTGAWLPSNHGDRPFTIIDAATLGSAYKAVEVA